jgi:neutral ceramidase
MRILATSVDISPQHRVPLAGYGVHRPCSGVERKLEANLLAFPDGKGRLVVLVSIDTLFSSEAFSTLVLQRLAESARLKLADFILVASHTHHAPALDPSKPLLGAVEFRYFDFAAWRIAARVDKLVAYEGETISLFRGVGSCRHNSSRRKRGLRLARRPPFLSVGINMIPNNSEDVPSDVAVVSGQRANGSVAFVLWQWMCHATASRQTEMGVTADFPGEVRQRMRECLAAPGLPVLFLPGFCGDLAVDYSLWPTPSRQWIMYPFQRPYARPSEQRYRGFCNILADEIIRVLAKSVPTAGPYAVGLAENSIPLARIMETTDPRTIRIRHVDAGPLSLLLVGAEVLSPYVERLAPLLAPHTLVSGYADDVLCYLPADRQIAEGGYEVDGFLNFFGINGRFKPKVETHIAEAVGEVVDRSRASVHLR